MTTDDLRECIACGEFFPADEMAEDGVYCLECAPLDDEDDSEDKDDE